jgi:hypothetical protein
MNRLAGLVIAGLVLMVGVTPSWGGPPNPTESDGTFNTAGGEGALFGNTGAFNTAFGYHALSLNAENYNTALGAEALNVNTGNYNTAIGFRALHATDLFSHFNSGESNTAVGAQTLFNNTTGGSNIATGVNALFNNTTGDSNTATGVNALFATSTGARNTALGFEALLNNTGAQNIAVGHGAGAALTTGNKNIYLGHPGVASESRTMRLGNVQTQTFIAGVATTALPSGVPVLIKANGKLGMQPSSARYKRDIETMGARSEGVLKLRPVTFAYKDDEQGGRQYGLIAEEVATVYPELVTHTATGEVQAVRYQELIPMLVNELQRQQHAMERQQHVTEHLQRDLAELRSLVGQMRGDIAQR